MTFHVSFTEGWNYNYPRGIFAPRDPRMMDEANIKFGLLLSQIADNQHPDTVRYAALVRRTGKKHINVRGGVMIVVYPE